ncbi:MAG TPA: cytochrome c oxidase assembly protein [Phenylobacterium sp.]|nr:cytochrome c oxidase assembly protein [Phenylobacterium sp.]
MTPPAPWTPYCGAGPTPGELAARWNLDPILLIAFAAAAMALIAASRARAPDLRRTLLAAGLGVLAVSFVSPVCALSSALFAARTVHHVLLVGAAAPLLACGLPQLRRPALGLSLALHAGVFWTWHAPLAYGAALSSDLAYWLMQLSLLASAVGFWASVRAAAAPAAVAALLAATVQMGLLGALLTFAEQPLYAPHFATTAAWGLTPLQDQQMSGLIMWAPASALYLGMALLLLGRWLGREERAAATA